MSDIKYGVAWNDSFKLGSDLVDAQHRKLFELLSDLIESCETGAENTKLEESLNFLVNYTVQHFKAEENLQIHYDYPDYERHRKLHEDFKETVGELVQRFADSGSTKELSDDMNKIVARWLVNHIQVEDKKIGAYIRGLEKQ